MKSLLLLVFALDLYGVGEVTPIVTAEGEHQFTFVGKPDKAIKKQEGGEEEWLNRTLSILLASQRWCLNGWEVTDQTETGGYLFINGRCR